MDYQRVPGKKNSSGCLKFCLIGCAATTTLIITSIVVAFLLLRSKGPILFAKTLTFLSDTAVTNLEISDEQKDQIRTHLKKISTRVEEGHLSLDSMYKVMSELENGVFPPLMFIEFFKKNIRQAKNLSQEEIGQALLDLERLQRALVEGKVAAKAFKDIWPMDEKNPMDQQVLEKMTESEWRDFMSRTRGVVDQVGIPSEHYTVDFVHQIGLLVDSVLNETKNLPPAELPPSLPATPLILEANGLNGTEAK